MAGFQNKIYSFNKADKDFFPFIRWNVIFLFTGDKVDLVSVSPGLLLETEMGSSDVKSRNCLWVSI